MDIETRILEQAQELFFRYGAKSVTMDDIARQLGMSKKTIYQYFSNKADIIYEVTCNFLRCEQMDTEKVLEASQNAIHELMLVMQASGQTFRMVSPNLLYEIEKYYPKAWEVFEAHKRTFIIEKIKENLLRGIEEGLYRPDLEVEIVARMRMMQIETSLRGNLFPRHQFDPLQVQLQMFQVYLYGIATAKGREHIQAFNFSTLSNISSE